MVDYTQYVADYPQVHKKLFKFLSDANALRSEQSKRGSYQAYAKIFERQANITSVSGNWKMPEGYSEASLQETIADRAFLRDLIQDKMDGYII